MQGYCTMGLEAYEQLPQKPTHIFLQAGVGSMAAAIAALFASAYADARPKIIIVEPEQADCFYRTAKADDGNGHPTAGKGIKRLIQSNSAKKHAKANIQNKNARRGEPREIDQKLGDGAKRATDKERPQAGVKQAHASTSSDTMGAMPMILPPCRILEGLINAPVAARRIRFISLSSPFPACHMSHLFFNFVYFCTYRLFMYNFTILKSKCDNVTTALYPLIFKGF
jgi:hypothetical protein